LRPAPKIAGRIAAKELSSNSYPFKKNHIDTIEKKLCAYVAKKNLNCLSVAADSLRLGGFAACPAELRGDLFFFIFSSRKAHHGQPGMYKV
jgi:hypothetical protein